MRKINFWLALTKTLNHLTASSLRYGRAWMQAYSPDYKDPIPEALINAWTYELLNAS